MINNIETFLEQIKEQEGEAFTYDSDGLTRQYQSIDDNQSGITLKILSIFGGLLGMIAFFVALAILNFFDRGTNALVLGFVFLIGAIVINRVTKTIFFDTISVSAFITSFLLIDFGLFDFDANDTAICLVNMLLAVIALAFSKNYIYTFLSILVLEMSSLFLIMENDAYNLVHAYIAINILVLTVWIMNEGRIIANNKKLSRIYAPVRIGIIFSLIIGLGLIGIREFYLDMNGANLTWISSIVTIPIMFYLVAVILNVLEIDTVQAKGIVFGICALILASIFNAPAISGAMVILLLCFYANYQTGIVIGIIALVYFVGQYYYDLNLTLLTKSIILFSSGILFLILSFLTHKKLETHEAH